MSDRQVSGVVHSSMTLRGQTIPTETQDIDQKTLRFYVDNPRIYSLVRSDDRTPDQDEICEKLQEHEHVKELISSIDENGGLMDPVVVRAGDLVVLEGNSRLAAYRHLVTKNPIKWAKIRCTVLPADIDEKLVFALLGEYHIKGKKDWAPYERAGFLYRRHKQHAIPLSVVAQDIGISDKEAKHVVQVFEFMIQHKDTDRERWSYYDEYLKSQKIKKIREEHAGFDDLVVRQIKDKSIPTAMDLRDKLPTVCTAPTKVIKRFMEGRYTLEEAYEGAKDAGSENNALNKLKRFREWLARADTKDDMNDATKRIRDRMLYELKEIERRSGKLKEMLEKIKTRVD